MSNKVKTIAILILVYLTGCGPEVIHWSTCKDAKYYIDGLCVDPGPFPVDPTVISTVMNLVEEEVNVEITDRELNLEGLFSSLMVAVGYREQILESKPHVRGVTLRRNMLVQGGSCWRHYYVLGHEMLHVIANYYSGADGLDNARHQLPGYFIIWAQTNEIDLQSTIEGRLMEAIKNICPGPYKLTETTDYLMGE